MEYRFIVTGGGTSGHINPAITIADTLKEMYTQRGDTCRIIFTGRAEGLEGDLVPRAGYEFRNIEAKPFPMRPGPRMAKAISALRHGEKQCFEIINEFGPDAVIGTGGYVCPPLLLSAEKKGIPVVIHEANAFPGRANKLVARKASLVLTGFPGQENVFKGAKRIVCTGNPIRSIMFGNTYEGARAKLGIPEGQKFVYAMGGSLGSKTINDFIVKTAALPEFSDVKFVLSSGKQQTGMIASGETLPPNLEVMEYINNTNDYMMGADVCITRSGAVTCAETAALPSCSVMVPYPYAAHDHQTFNARAFADIGGCILMSDSDVAEGKLTNVLADLLADEERRLEMRKKAATLATPECSRVIFEEIDRLVRK